MKRSERIKSLNKLFKNSILEYARQDLGWYLKRMETLVSQDLSNPAVQDQLKHITHVVINRYEEMAEEEKEKKTRQIGFRVSKLAQRLTKLNVKNIDFVLASIQVLDPIALEKKIRSYQSKAIKEMFSDPDILFLIERLPDDDKAAINDGLYGLEQIMHVLLTFLEKEVESGGGDFTYTADPKKQLS